MGDRIRYRPRRVFTFTPLCWYAYSPYCSLYISHGTDKENLFDNQELLQLVIIFVILVTSTCD